MVWNPEIPYTGLPPLPPRDLDIEPKSVLKALLQDVKVGRERLFVNHEFLDVLTRTD